MGTLASSKGPVQKTAQKARLGKTKNIFPLSHRPGDYGWMFAWKNHGRNLGRIDGWWSDLLPPCGDSA
jgi:hypothetical protein